MENITPPSKQKRSGSGESNQGSFGRKEDALLWIDRAKLAEIAPSLKADPELQLDSLEHLTVMAMDDLLVATYFLRSFDHPEKQLILRTTVSSGPKAALPSVRGVWPMAAPFEAEMTERFGIRFFDQARESASH